MSKTGPLDLGNKQCSFNLKPCCKTLILLRDHNAYLNHVSSAIDIQGEIKYLKNKYHRVFQYKIGCALDYEVRLKLKDTNPVCMKP